MCTTTHLATPLQMTRRTPPPDPSLSIIPEIITILAVTPRLQPAAHCLGWLRQPQLVAARSKAVWLPAKDTPTSALNTPTNATAAIRSTLALSTRLAQMSPSMVVPCCAVETTRSIAVAQVDSICTSSMVAYQYPHRQRPLVPPPGPLRRQRPVRLRLCHPRLGLAISAAIRTAPAIVHSRVLLILFRVPN